MNMAAILLTLAYLALAVLILILSLYGPWRWRIKGLVLLAALPVFIGTFWAHQALLGWPTGDLLPSAFQLHGAVIEEPGRDDDRREGTVYLWLTDNQTHDGPSPRPRAFALPYSRDLHERVDKIKKALRDGQRVEGAAKARPTSQRRFNDPSSLIEFYVPPSPTLPPKAG